MLSGSFQLHQQASRSPPNEKAGGTFAPPAPRHPQPPGKLLRRGVFRQTRILVPKRPLIAAGPRHAIGPLPRPCPPGSGGQQITFSFSPVRLSVLPAVAASVSTRVVSWKDAALMKLLVSNEAFVMPEALKF
jgi:hypothetical protein